MKNPTRLVAFLFGLSVLTLIVSCDHRPKQSESNFGNKYFPQYIDSTSSQEEETNPIDG